VRLEPSASPADLRDDWERLAAASGNVFATPDFAELWLERYGAGAEPRLYAVRDGGGEVQAILPLVLRRRGPLRLLRWVGHGPGDELGPVCAPESRALAVDALRQVLAGGGFDVFVGEQLPPWAADGVGRELGREGSPLLLLEGRTWDDVLAARSRNFREQVRRRERKLAREHELHYRLADDASLDDDLETLFRLHRARWGRDDTNFARREPFYRALARRALDRGRLRLWLLELDGAPRAAWLGFRFEGAESYYQLGRDPAWDAASVGFVLLSHTIRAAAEDGMREYRFLRGDESYKYRFANGDPGLETVALARGGVGALAVSAALALREARRALRRLRSS
jgi:CelD/BcsL family acetyltransferase involved in cellulose biosynthesis